MTKPRVSPDVWSSVVERDARAIWEESYKLALITIPYHTWRRRHGTVCIVELLDPPASVNCSGRQTVDHVRDAPGAVRKHDAQHLTAMCAYHNVDHPPSKKLRAAQRRYLGIEEHGPDS